MTDVEMRFFDEYKKLYALCKDMYAFEKGVTDYLNNMEENFQQGTHAVRGWDRDYRAIKRLRHIRNLIGHEAGSSGCTEADYLELQKLHLRFLRREDPLALLKKAEYNAEKDAAEGQRAAADAAFATVPQQTLRRKAKGQSALRMAAVILLLFVMALAAAGIAAIIFMFA